MLQPTVWVELMGANLFRCTARVLNSLTYNRELGPWRYFSIAREVCPKADAHGGLERRLLVLHVVSVSWG